MSDSNRVRRRNAAEMFPLIEQYLRDEVTRKAFCEREHVPLTVFQYWLKKYWNCERSPQSASKPGFAKRFLPISLPAASPAACEIHFPNGVYARFAHAADASALLERLHALGD